MILKIIHSYFNNKIELTNEEQQIIIDGLYVLQMNNEYSQFFKSVYCQIDKIYDNKISDSKIYNIPKNIMIEDLAKLLSLYFTDIYSYQNIKQKLIKSFNYLINEILVNNPKMNKRYFMILPTTEEMNQYNIKERSIIYCLNHMSFE